MYRAAIDVSECLSILQIDNEKMFVFFFKLIYCSKMDNVYMNLPLKLFQIPVYMRLVT